MVHRVVAAVSVARLLKPAQKAWGVDPEELWAHSVTTAFGTQFIAADFDAEGGVFFTAGLLHDVGKIILAEAYKEDYARLVAEGEKTGKPVFELEQAAYHVNHASIGGRLLARWKSSAELVASVAFHHHPAGAGHFQQLAAYLGVADFLAREFRRGPRAETDAALDAGAAGSILGLSSDDLARYLAQIKENNSFVEAMCRLG